MKSNDWQIDWALDEYGVLSKLIFGEPGVRVTEGILRTLGFVHLYTASGIHLYAFLDAVERLTQRLVLLLGKRTFWAKRLGFILGVITLAYLWSLQSFRIGFARPILIFLIRLWAKERGVRWRLFYPLLITFGLDYLLSIESGRVHYYLAVGGGLLGMDWAKQRKWGAMGEHIAMAFASWISTAAIDLVMNHQVAWMTPFWSLVTIPVISIILYPLTIGVMLMTHGIPSWIFELWNHLMKACVWVADQGFTFSVISPSAVGIAFVLAMISVWMLHRVRHLRWTFVGIGFSLLVCLGFSPSDSRVVQIDVGQGDSLLVKKDERVEMVDVGSGRALRPHQWIQKLSVHGVDHVDVILLSHLDEDHTGGLLNMAEWVPISVIQTHARHWRSEKGQKMAERIEERRADLRLSDQNELKLMQLSWFESTSGKRDGNSFMAGVLVPMDANRVYLGLGDGDVTQEAQYLKYFSNELSRYPDRIWKAGHHGSKYSSGWTEMKALHPTRVWVSVGRKNRYHHPSVEAMSRLNALHLSIYRTDEAGDLVEKTSQPFFERML